MLAVRRIQLSPEWVSSQFIHGRVSSIGVAFFYFGVAWNFPCVSSQYVNQRWYHVGRPICLMARRRLIGLRLWPFSVADSLRRLLHADDEASDLFNGTSSVNKLSAVCVVSFTGMMSLEVKIFQLKLNAADTKNIDNVIWRVWAGEYTRWTCYWNISHIYVHSLHTCCISWIVVLLYVYIYNMYIYIYSNIFCVYIYMY